VALYWYEHACNMGYGYDIDSFLTECVELSMKKYGHFWGFSGKQQSTWNSSSKSQRPHQARDLSKTKPVH